MHKMNVEKAVDNTIRDILNKAGIVYEVFDLPATYSVISVCEMLPLSVIEEIRPLLTIENPKTWDRALISTDGSTQQEWAKLLANIEWESE